MKSRLTVFLSCLFLLGLLIAPEKGWAGSSKKLKALKRSKTVTLTTCALKGSNAFKDDKKTQVVKDRQGDTDKEKKSKRSRTERY